MTVPTQEERARIEAWKNLHEAGRLLRRSTQILKSFGDPSGDQIAGLNVQLLDIEHDNVLPEGSTVSTVEGWQQFTLEDGTVTY